jgi:flagella basal body P-ring formation protein FlgA
MAALLLLALLAGAPAGDGRSLAQSAAADALTVQGARAEILEYLPRIDASCAAASATADRRVSSSGPIALRLSGRDARGRPCQGWAWARVKVVASVMTAARAIRRGEPMEGAARLEERELRSAREPLFSLPEGAKAAQSLAAGQMLEPHHLLDASSPALGAPIPVVLRRGPVSVALEGTAVPCPRGKACAQLPSGRRVEGQLIERRLVVVIP